MIKVIVNGFGFSLEQRENGSMFCSQAGPTKGASTEQLEEFKFRVTGLLDSSDALAYWEDPLNLEFLARFVMSGTFPEVNAAFYKELTGGKS